MAEKNVWQNIPRLFAAEAIKEDYQTLILLVVLSLLHMALYLPLPSNDPEAWACRSRGTRRFSQVCGCMRHCVGCGGMKIYRREYHEKTWAL